MIEAKGRGKGNLSGRDANIKAVQEIKQCGGNVVRATGVPRKLKEVGVQANVITYIVLVSVCAKAKDLEAARAFFAEMKEAGIQPDTISLF